MRRIGDGPLNGTNYTREDDLAMMSTPSAWPNGPRLPVKRRGEFGVIVEGEGPVVHPLRLRAGDGPSAVAPRTYGSWDELLDDGWVVD